MRVVRAALLAAILSVGGAAQAADGMSKAEFETAARARLMRADTDGDGRLSAAEWTAAAGKLRGMAAGAGGARGALAAHADPAKMFGRLDANHDGYLDAAELGTLADRRFARLDANGDGRVTPDERQAKRGGGAE